MILRTSSQRREVGLEIRLYKLLRWIQPKVAGHEEDVTFGLGVQVHTEDESKSQNENSGLDSERGDDEMDNLVAALGPVFAAGFAVQQLLEILDSLFLRWFLSAGYKKAIPGVLVAATGLVLSFGTAGATGLAVLPAMKIADALAEVASSDSEQFRPLSTLISLQVRKSDSASIFVAQRSNRELLVDQAKKNFASALDELTNVSQSLERKENCT